MKTIVSPGAGAVPSFRGFFSSLRLLTVLVFAASAFAYILLSVHWHMTVDTPVMHYVVFLMHHGLKPYSDITDNNMPGAYLTEAAAMSVFGGGDLAWRVYEFFLLGIAGVAAVSIARRWDWVAGVFAVGLFTVLHGAEGPQLAVERELVIAVLLVCAAAVLFESVDRSWPTGMLVMGLLCGICISVKPTYAPLPFLLWIPAFSHLRSRHISLLPFAAWTLAGLGIVGLAVLAFLLHFQAMGAFTYVLTHVLPAYGSSGRASIGRLAVGLLPRVVLLEVVVTSPVLIWVLRRAAWDWRIVSLVLIAACGALSYFVQGKGYVYHRYIFLIFLLMLMGIAQFAAMRQAGWPRWMAAVFLLLAFAVVPGHLRSAQAIPAQTSFEGTLERDLKAMGGGALSGRVQCMDLVYGCLDALYHQGIVDPAGFTGDMLFFAPVITPPVRFYRDRFWDFARREPADILVVSNGLFAEPNNYGKLDRWPDFSRYLQTDYVQIVERRFPHEEYTYFVAVPDRAKEPDSYRLYVRAANPALVALGKRVAGETLVPAR